ncbi:replication initiation protein [Mesorhizobium calcicola]|uniref:Replication initiation protein n=1 Tax=Mesorhizobium calcicola TaxID=1300310 RepID=A0ABW4WDI1_9HYPH
MLHQPKPPVGHRVSKRTAEGLFRPETRGDLDQAFSSKGKLQIVAPESPRPSEMLEGVTVGGRDELTADDHHLHEYLISRAYADNMPMTEETHSLDMTDAIRFLGSRVERSDIRASLARLKRTTVSYGQSSERRFEDVQLLEGWVEIAPGSDVIRYRLPEPLRVLMRDQRQYAYVELAALPRMRSKFSTRLYKMFALKAKDRPWVPGEDNVITVSGTPDEVADWIGFPKEADGRVHGGKLRARFLEKAIEDFADVRAFRMEMDLKQGGRGNAIQAVTFTLHLSPPSRHTVPMFFKPSDDKVRVGNKDVPHLRVESRTWRRAATKFSHALGMTNRGFADMWQIAVNEANTGVALSDGYHSRKFRGRKLLDAIQSRGADYAAWGFVTEEADAPDIGAKRMTGGYGALEKEADEARQARVGFGKRRRGKAPAFIVDEGELDHVPAAQVSFSEAKEIIFDVDPALTSLDIEPLVGLPIQRRVFTGDRKIALTLRFLDRGQPDVWKLGRFPVSEADLDGILKSLGRFFDGPEEYV